MKVNRKPQAEFNDGATSWKVEGATTNECNKPEVENINSKYDYSVDLRFIERLVQEVTRGCALPFAIPKTRMPQIIETCAEWFFEHSESALEERWFVVRDIDMTDGANKIAQLPPQIWAVSDVQLLESQHKLSMRRANFYLERLLSNSINFYSEANGVSFNYAGPAGSQNASIADDLWVTMYEIGTYESILQRTITYNFNRFSHKLNILGDNEGSDLVLMCWVRVPLQSLYEDRRFLRYCTGQCMQELADIIGTYDFKLPGNVRINFDRLASKGQTMQQQVEKELEAEQSGDVFIALT